jgi:hypothetical protein
MTDEQLLEYRKTQLAKLREENSKLREDLREGKALREMSIERKILKKILMLYREDKSCMNWGTANEIQVLLAKPEQQVKTNRVFYQEGYAQAELDLKREPLSDEEIDLSTTGMSEFGSDMFKAGIRAAERAHGIGVDDEFI